MGGVARGGVLFQLKKKSKKTIEETKCALKDLLGDKSIILLVVPTAGY